ncbi:hypothetical protein SETIT_8G001800v2 [Setaria italica]|uniref:Uncharacterized protein n=1 Tax=Setaria italica TaxID=4555 RepID=A0A368S2M9_SETIT|nr:hypothetical protein SETIT_8G001800v2 [Setaria italica]
MAPPRRLPAATPARSDSPPLVSTGNKENISDAGGATVPDYCRPAPCQEGAAFSPNINNKPAPVNLRKSIAWNPAFFTDQGVLDNLELSLLTGSQLKANGSPRSGVAGGTVSPFCRSGRSGTACVLKEVAENSHGKLPAKYRTTEKQGRKLFSSVKTPQRDQRRECTETQNKASSRSIQKCIPRLPSGSIQKKVPNSSSAAQMSGIPKKSQHSLPTVPRSTSSSTTILKSNVKLGPVNAEQIHRVPGLPPKSKINSVSSGSDTVKDVVPAVTAFREDASGSVERKNFLPNPQIIPSSSFGGPASNFTKPSALRMPSPSVGFFTQENAHVSYGNAAKRNVGNTSSVVKPPRYKQPEDLNGRVHITKPLSTNCTAASNVPPVIRESNPNTLVAPEKEFSSKFITSKYSAKSGYANNQERSDVNCLLAGIGATIQPPNPAKNDAARYSTPVVYSDTSHVERRDISKEVESFENSYPLKGVCPSTIEPVEDSSFKSTCPLTKPIVGSTSSSSSISSRVCSSSDLTCQSKSESGSGESIYLGNSCVEETTTAISLSKGESCTPGLDLSRGFDSHNHQNTECAVLMESVESTVCADQAPCCGSSKGKTPALADCNSDFGDSLCNESKPASSEEPNAEGEIELETNNAPTVEETLSLHVEREHNHNYMSTEPSPMKLEAPTPCVERQHALSVEPNMEDKMVLNADKLSALEGASQIENVKALDRSRTNTILKDHLKNLVPFTEEWLAVMEARGQEVLEQKTGAVQNSPPDKTAPEPSPWSPVKRKAQDVGPFDCTKYSKSVRTSDAPPPPPMSSSSLPAASAALPPSPPPPPTSSCCCCGSCTEAAADDPPAANKLPSFPCCDDGSHCCWSPPPAPVIPGPCCSIIAPNDDGVGRNGRRSRNDDGVVPGLDGSDKGAKGREWWSLLGSSKPPTPVADMNVGSTLDKLAAVGGGIIISSCCVLLFIFLESLELEDDADGFCFFFRQRPPTGTLRRVPPLVQ